MDKGRRIFGSILNYVVLRIRDIDLVGCGTSRVESRMCLKRVRSEEIAAGLARVEVDGAGPGTRDGIGRRDEKIGGDADTGL